MLRTVVALVIFGLVGGSGLAGTVEPAMPQTSQAEVCPQEIIGAELAAGATIHAVIDIAAREC